MEEDRFFTMPIALSDQLGITLADILVPLRPTDDAKALPRAPGAALNVNRAKLKAEERGINGDWAFPQSLSDKMGAPRTIMPCVFHSNSQGYWLGSRGRHALVEEHAKAQGLEASARKRA